MDVLKQFFAIKTLKDVVILYFPQLNPSHELFENLKGVLIAHKEDLVFLNDISSVEAIPWDQFIDMIESYFIKSCNSFILHDTNAEMLPEAVNIFRNQSWKLLYETIGYKLMNFLIKKCHICIPVAPGSYMVLQEKSIETLCKNKIYRRGQITKTKVIKKCTLGYKPNHTISIMSALYSDFHLGRWGKHSKLFVPHARMTESSIDRIIDCILNEKVGIELKDISNNSCDIRKYMGELKPSIKTLLCKVNKGCCFKYYRKYINARANSPVTLEKRKRKPKSEKRKKEAKMPAFNKENYQKILNKRNEKIGTFLKPIPEKQVYDFISAAITNIIPIKMFGSKKNLQAFSRSVIKLFKYGIHIFLRLEELLRGIKVDKIKWLKEVPNKIVRQSILAKMCIWLWNNFVKELIRVYLYATEHMSYKNKILFYDHRDWFALKQMMYDYYLRNEIITKIDKTDIKGPCKLNSIGHIRWIPKNVGVRQILRIRRTIKEKEQLEIVKIFLQQLNEVVQKFSTSVGTDFNSLHTSWLNLFNQHCASTEKKLHFVKVDIQNAYECIRHKVLFKFIYLQISNILKGMKSIRLVKYKCLYICNGKLLYRNFRRFNEMPLGFPRRAIICTDQESTPQEFEVANIMKLIKGFVSYQTIRDGKHYYWIKQGVSQGGTSLSSLLCNLYYTLIEHTYLAPFTHEPSNHLFRRVDDFMYITPDLNMAKRFLEVMKDGFKTFRAFINDSKTVTNIDVPEEEFATTFYGYNFSSKLQIRSDFSNYQGIEMKHSFHIKTTSNYGRLLMEKLSMGAYLKLNLLTMDPLYNKFETIVLNIYNSSMMLAYRFHAIVHNFLDHYNDNFTCKVIDNTSRKFVNRVLALTNKEDKHTIGYYCVLWIYYTAFYTCLRQYSSKYPNELYFLGRTKNWRYNKIDSRDMRAVEIITDLGIPRVFKLIK